MVFILELPAELLGSIAELAGPHESITLTSVCRAFNVIATPYAYHTLVLDRRSLRLLLRTLLDQPNIGAHVRNLEFTHAVDSAEPAVNSDDLRQLAGDAAARELSLEVRAAVMDGSVGAMLFLLLHHLPSLQWLKLFPSMLADDLVFREICNTSTLPSGLQSLRSIDITNRHSRNRCWIKIAPFLRFPNLSTIRLIEAPVEEVNETIDAAHEALTAYGIYAGTSSGVERIHLEDSWCSLPYMTAIVKSCRVLKSLVYRHRTTIPDSGFSTGLARALRQDAQDSLEHLELDFIVDSREIAEWPDSLGSLRDFTQLNHLSTPISLLHDRSQHPPDLGAVLPSSLTSLYLEIDSNFEGVGWENVIVQLLEGKQNTVPLLKTLYLASPTRFDDTKEKTIREACLQAQVEVIFVTSTARNVNMELPELIELPDGMPDGGWIGGGDFSIEFNGNGGFVGWLFD